MAGSQEGLPARARAIDGAESDNERISTTAENSSVPNKVAPGTKRKALTTSPPTASTHVVKATMSGNGQRVAMTTQRPSTSSPLPNLQVYPNSTAIVEDEAKSSAEAEDQDVDMEDAAVEAPKHRVMGAKRYAQMPLLNHQEGDEQLKPIPRPLPSRASSWGNDDGGNLSAPSDEGNPSTPEPEAEPIPINQDMSIPFFNRDVTPDGITRPRAVTPSYYAQAESLNNGSGSPNLKFDNPYVGDALGRSLFAPEPTLVAESTADATSANAMVQATPVAFRNFDHLLNFGDIWRPSRPPAPQYNPDVLMSFHDTPDTPNISWVLRVEDEIREKERVANLPVVVKVKRVPGDPRKRRRSTLAGLTGPKREYKWKDVERKNKGKMYDARNGAPAKLGEGAGKGKEKSVDSDDDDESEEEEEEEEYSEDEDDNEGVSLGDEY